MFITSYEIWSEIKKTQYNENVVFEPESVFSECYKDTYAGYSRKLKKHLKDI